MVSQAAESNHPNRWARERILPVMGGVGALVGADMFASVEGLKPNRVVGDIGGMRHTTGRWPSSRRESGSKVDLSRVAPRCAGRGHGCRAPGGVGGTGSVLSDRALVGSVDRGAVYG